MLHVLRPLFESDRVNGSTRHLLRSASNYLSASAFLLREPGDEESELRLIERASALIDEATSIMNTIRQSSARTDVPRTHASLRVLIEKASSWLITPSGSKVTLELDIGENAGLVACEAERLTGALETLFAKACTALDQTKERRIAVKTRRESDRIAIEIRYAAPDFRDAMKGAAPDRSPGDLPPGPALPDYRRIISDHGGSLTADYDANGQIRLRIALPAAP